MRGVDRRAMLGAIGASLAVPSFSGGSSIAAPPAIDTPDGLEIYNRHLAIASSYKVAGVHDPYEIKKDPPDANGKFKPKKYPNEFTPNHICLVYMKFNNGKLLAKHAHFLLSVLDTFAKISEQFEKMRSGRPSGEIKYGENFEAWNFGSQSLIYIALDNDGTVIFDPDNLIQFAPYSARRVGGTKPLKKPNNTFLNAMIDRGIFPPNEVLVLENWYSDMNGKPINNVDKNYEEFAMNIHLFMDTQVNEVAGGFKNLPIVVDPDTGNNGAIP